MKRFAKIVNGYKLLTIFTKRSILDVWQGSEYASGIDDLSFYIWFNDSVWSGRKMIKLKYGQKIWTFNLKNEPLWPKKI